MYLPKILETALSINSKDKKVNNRTKITRGLRQKQIKS